MWLDNASNIDMLFYSPYADTIVNFIKEPELTPLTIGLYGSWGAGKSPLLQLIQQNIENNVKEAVCISLNAWQFEGYEDAKVAIMESLLKLLQSNSEFDGEIKQLKEVETCINNDKELNENYKLWKNPRVIRWVKSEPKNTIGSKEISKLVFNNFKYLLSQHL